MWQATIVSLTCKLLGPHDLDPFCPPHLVPYLLAGCLPSERRVMSRLGILHGHTLEALVFVLIMTMTCNVAQIHITLVSRV